MYMGNTIILCPVCKVHRPVLRASKDASGERHLILDCTTPLLLTRFHSVKDSEATGLTVTEVM